MRKSEGLKEAYSAAKSARSDWTTEKLWEGSVRPLLEGADLDSAKTAKLVQEVMKAQVEMDDPARAGVGQVAGSAGVVNVNYECPEDVYHKIGELYSAVVRRDGVLAPKHEETMIKEKVKL